MRQEAAPPANFPLVSIPEDCANCFFAQGVVLAVNRVASELQSTRLPETDAHYQSLKAQYVGGCALMDEIRTKCKGTSLLRFGREPLMFICGYAGQVRPRKRLPNLEDLRPTTEN